MTCILSYMTCMSGMTYMTYIYIYICIYFFDFYDIYIMFLCRLCDLYSHSCCLGSVHVCVIFILLKFFLENTPYDGSLQDLFFGEEISMAAR
jgi:hypothetical protein